MHAPRSLTALLAALALLPFTAGAAGAADLRVTVSHGPATASILYIALFDSAEAMAADKPLASQTLPMHDGTAQPVFTGLPPGRYALKSFADENGNGRIDKNIVGMPTERYGFSNDAMGPMGPPDFEAAAVPVDADGSIAVHLR